MRILGQIEISHVDGPGARAVLHLAGCSIGCPGCFNPHTHASVGNGVRNQFPEQLAQSLLAVSSEITISGGEPTDQLPELLLLLRALKQAGAGIIVYSGRTRQALQKKPEWRLIEQEALIDVLIDGPFVLSLMETKEMKGSQNQVIHLLTERYQASDFDQRLTEVQLDEQGNLVILGFPTQEFLQAVRELAA
jgi:anaerobic ribonucleoside-triphosphate reductase activating protein